MTEWKSLAGKFTSEELEVIKEFQKLLGVNKNQFVRISVILMMFGYGILLQFAESYEAKNLDKKYQKLRKKISKYPELREIQPAIEAMTNSWEQALERIVKENEPEIKKFTKKRKAGRPKSKKRKRGKPKDTGI